MLCYLIPHPARSLLMLLLLVLVQSINNPTRSLSASVHRLISAVDGAERTVSLSLHLSFVSLTADLSVKQLSLRVMR